MNQHQILPTATAVGSGIETAALPKLVSLAQLQQVSPKQLEANLEVVVLVAAAAFGSVFRSLPQLLVVPVWMVCTRGTRGRRRQKSYRGHDQGHIRGRDPDQDYDLGQGRDPDQD
jgi:hypothetical protein